MNENKDYISIDVSFFGKENIEELLGLSKCYHEKELKSIEEFSKNNNTDFDESKLSWVIYDALKFALDNQEEFSKFVNLKFQLF